MGAKSTKQKQPQTKQRLAVSEIGQRGQLTNQSQYLGQSRSKNKRTYEYPYNCIGLLGWQNLAANSSIEYGTAFLISPNLILTALHNVVDRMGFKNKSMKFYPQLHEDYHNAEFLNIKASRHNEEFKGIIDIKDEYCLLLLDRQIQREKYIPLGYGYNIINNCNTEIYGYPFDLIQQADNVTYQFGCKGRIVDIEQQAIHYQHTTFKGQSGAPIIATLKDGNKVAIGIHCKADNNKRLNLGLRFTFNIIDKFHVWAQQLTKEKSKIKALDVSKQHFEQNPLQQYKKQNYNYVTLIPQIKTVSIPNEQSQPKRIKPTSRIVLDLWKTIQNGVFNVNYYPYNCIGLIIGTYMDLKSRQIRKHYGTGFLINSNIVLTSIYNLIKFQQGYTIQYENLVFYPKLHGDINSEENQVRHVLYTKYNIPKIRPTSQKDIVETSLAMLIIDEHIKRHRYILIGQNFQEIDQVYLFGYGWNQLNKTETQQYTKFNQRGSEGKIIETTQEVIYHNAYSQAGSQGSPLLVQYIKGLFFIVGIHIRNKYEKQKQNCLALKMTSRRVGMLKKWLKDIPQEKGQDKKKQRIFSYNLKETEAFGMLEWKNEGTIFPNEQISNLKKLYKQNQDRYTKSDILIRSAQLLSKMGKYQQSNNYLMLQTKLQEHSFFISSQISKIHYCNHMGVNNLEMKELKNAQAQFNQALDLIDRYLKQINTPNKDILRACYNNIAICKAMNGDKKSSQEYFMKAMSLTAEKESQYRCLLANNMSILYFQSQKTQEHVFEQQLFRILNSVHRIKSASQLLILAKIGYNLSIYYFSTFNYRKGLDYLQNYLNTMTNLGLTNHPNYKENLLVFYENIQQLLTKQIPKEVVLRMIKIIRKYVDPANHNLAILDKMKERILPEGLY